ncbi:valine--tRNA ligase [Candidatus Uhrbacteria bacterium]|nr:valine--tRNA ligase [Candidatus Uhrbacteria bacterium]
MSDFPSSYDPKLVEDSIYNMWEESGLFNPDTVKGSGDRVQGIGPTSFSVVLPPPNVTGTLHLGHATMLAIEDIMVRYHRMKGDDTVWVPGTDHAAIATQNVVEKKLWKEEKKTRHDLGREKFLKKVDEFVKASKDTIHRQMRKMGASLDWSREAYTLDAPRERAVRTAFKMMYDDELIYRGHRIVNWCTRCQSTLADDEVSYKEEKTKFYYLKYGPVVIGTARPETKFLDKVIIVHPKDKRYESMVGTSFDVEWIDGTVKATVVADESAEMEMGSGAMTITPAHSFTDFALAQKYGFEIHQIINEKGVLTDAAGDMAGMPVAQAREKVIERLQAKGLVDHIDENYVHNLSVCYRCDTPVEPLVSQQWFINVNKNVEVRSRKLEKIVGKKQASLKEMAAAVVRNGAIKIIPKRFDKTYFHWMDNLRDWCISRQIWFGHRIPVWYCHAKEARIQNLESRRKQKGLNSKFKILDSEIGCKPIVSIDTPDGCPSCGNSQLEQDPDTLDTWFSSGLWTFSTLGWPQSVNREQATGNSDLKRFHPTSVLETGYDILFFWVARMILMTTYVLGEVPFETVYLHGLVRDEQGRKMSKSLGNAIDPLIVSEKYGTDAVRLALVVGTTPGNDLKLSEKKIEGYRNFVNKLWNVARYVSSQGPGSRVQGSDIDDSTLYPRRPLDPLSPPERYSISHERPGRISVEPGRRNLKGIYLGRSRRLVRRRLKAPSAKRKAKRIDNAYLIPNTLYHTQTVASVYAVCDRGDLQQDKRDK